MCADGDSCLLDSLLVKSAVAGVNSPMGIMLAPAGSERMGDSGSSVSVRDTLETGGASLSSCKHNIYEDRRPFTLSIARGRNLLDFNS